MASRSRILLPPTAFSSLEIAITEERFPNQMKIR
ncbi:hypothetical protein CCACVL1_06892 [Corchorus capsularis]|uniref:Uncharacterized protein n=1 Tax=Corchorus capsularis TaxID=210143 RepID=A0A1R3JBV8_COCAP|nr:hypothetical protein CCACVL1_06892 [Corchorus capsularis]